MTEFQREDRYIVIKLKHLRSAQGAPFPDNKIHGLLNYLRATGVEPVKDAVVIEADWPEHEAAWRMIERRMTGQWPASGEIETLALAALGGLIDGNELADIDLLYNFEALERLQRERVTTSEVVDIELVERTHVARLQTDLINMREERDVFMRKVDNFDKTIAGVPALARAEKLQAEVKRLQALTSTSMGVGDGSGQLIVHGDYDSIKAAQRILWERDDLQTLINNVRERFTDNVDVRNYIDGLLEVKKALAEEEARTSERPTITLNYRQHSELKRLAKHPDACFGSCTNLTMNALKECGLVDIEWRDPPPGHTYRVEKWVITQAGRERLDHLLGRLNG